MKKNLILKAALLSCCFVTASVNAVAGNIPAMEAAFPDVPAYLIELMTTIPSLLSMASVLLAGKIASVTGYKKMVLGGCLLSGAAGTLPFFLRNIWLILAARAAFGFGCGLISSSLLILIVYFFQGDERSQMIGLQGSAGGLASLVTAFIAGRLLVFGWNVSFLVYLFGFAVFFVFLLFVPHVGSIHSASASGEKQPAGKTAGLIGLGILMFVSVLAATLFVIKCASLAEVKNLAYGGSGSLLVMCISAGSLIAGFFYGNMMKILKRIALPVFYLICAAGFVMAAYASDILFMYIGAFLLGFGYLAFVPFLQERVSDSYAGFGSAGTSVVLVFQGLGAFAAPYLGTALSAFTSSLSGQFILTAGIFAALAVLSAFLYRKA